MNDVPVMMISVDELKNNSDSGLERVKELLQKSFPALDIKTESRLGDVVDELKDLCKETKPFAIVVGKHGASGVERFLFGSTTLSIIRHATAPVISVPESTGIFQIRNIALAVDAREENISMQMIKEIVSRLHASLSVVHIEAEKNTAKDFATTMPGLDTPYTTIKDNEFVHGIEAYVRENKIDMIVIIPHKHSSVERLFFKTHTTELVQKIKIPIMCVPEVNGI
jgi:nucleotide-binding universal stress UspA family protein